MKTTMTRRQVLTGATLAVGLGAGVGLSRGLSALASVTVGPEARRRTENALVVLFLRGGADGLNILVPHGDDDYYRLRPTLSLARPNDKAAPATARALDLDGFFGLHPALAPLLPLYRDGRFVPVHAVGSGDQTRSHFEAMATMERGLAGASGAASGWLARHLTSTAHPDESPLRAVALSETMPDSLRGATNATALTNLADFRIHPPVVPTGADGQLHHALPEARQAALADTLARLYADSPDAKTLTGGQAISENGQQALTAAGRETLAAIDAVRKLDPAHYRPAPGVVYPDSELGSGLRQAACLLKGNVGLEIATLDMGGWDTHVAQGRDAGWQPLRLADLGRSLAAFAADLGPALNRATVLVMTEFGRRAYENSGLGTDHGRASCLFVLGGGVAGGKVVSQWPGLGAHQLDSNGDLRVTTDYRDILAELLSRRLANAQLDQVFSDYAPRFHDLLTAGA